MSRTNELYDTIAKDILQDWPDAIEFLCRYHNYCHAIDDIIDEHITDPEVILAAFMLAADVYNCDFYLANRHWLLPMISHVTNTYADSVVMERSTEVSWHKTFADAIRNCANDMAVQVVVHCRGWAVGRKLSMLLRTDSYNKHHTEEGKPV